MTKRDLLFVWAAVWWTMKRVRIMEMACFGDIGFVGLWVCGYGLFGLMWFVTSPVTLSGAEGALLLGSNAPSAPLRVTEELTSRFCTSAPLRVTELVTFHTLNLTTILTTPSQNTASNSG